MALTRLYSLRLAPTASRHVILPAPAPSPWPRSSFPDACSATRLASTLRPLVPYRPRPLQPVSRLGASSSRVHAAYPYAGIATATQDVLPKTLPEYSPPTTGVLSYLPRQAVPYAELMRIDKPTGSYYLFFPCLFSTLVAATMATPIAAPSAVISTTALFFTGALVMRGAGCTVNDLWDRNLDPHVE